MIGFGIIGIIIGVVLFVTGQSINNDMERQMESLFSSGKTNPGDVYVTIGVVIGVLGLILLIAGIVKKANNGNQMGSRQEPNHGGEQNSQNVESVSSSYSPRNVSVPAGGAHVNNNRERKIINHSYEQHPNSKNANENNKSIRDMIKGEQGKRVAITAGVIGICFFLFFIVKSISDPNKPTEPPYSISYSKAGNSNEGQNASDGSHSNEKEPYNTKDKETEKAIESDGNDATVSSTVPNASTTELSTNSTESKDTTFTPKNPYDVVEEKRKALTIDKAFIGKTISIEEKTAQVFQGSITEENEKNSHSFFAPTDGLYFFDLKAPYDYLRVKVKDSSGDTIMEDTSGGRSVKLKGGNTYEIIVQFRGGYSSYTLTVGIPKPSTDISGATTINDQISFEEQRNVYYYTASKTGRYRLDLLDTKSSEMFRLLVWDSNDKNLAESTSGGTDVSFSQGQTYRIEVQHRSDFGRYSLQLMIPKDTKDISGCSIVKDSIEFENQRNNYYFIPPYTGLYRFSIQEINANCSVSILIWDEYDITLLERGSDGGCVMLEAGKTYRVQIRYVSGYSSYALAIGYQKKTIDISDYDLIRDRISFEGQRNEYSFKPKKTGKYTLSLKSYVNSCILELVVLDKYRNAIIYSTSTSNTIELTHGEQYCIRIQQNSDYSEYELIIEKG